MNCSTRHLTQTISLGWLIVGSLSAAHAADRMTCRLGTTTASFDIVRADLQYSSAGHPGHDGKLALFRIVAAGAGPSIELKSDNLLTAGTYPLSTRAIWKSVVTLDRKRRAVTQGEFKIESLQIQGTAGHVKGSSDFLLETGDTGHCAFDLEMHVIDRRAA